MSLLARLRCARARRDMLRALAGELPERPKRRLAGHLGSCPDCRPEARSVADLVRGLVEAGAPDPGPHYWESFPARVRRRIEAARFRPPAAALSPKASGARQERWCRAALAAALLAAVALALAGAPRVPRDGAAALARAVQDPRLVPLILPGALEVEDPVLDLQDSLARLSPEQAERLRSRLEREIGADRRLPPEEKHDAS